MAVCVPIVCDMLCDVITCVAVLCVSWTGPWYRQTNVSEHAEHTH